MNILIYFIITVLYAVLIFWTWNNTKDFEENAKRVFFIIIGIIVITIITLMIFNLAKVGVEYPNKEIANQIRKMAILLFVPINGFLSLPHIAKIKADISLNSISDEKSKKRIIVLGIIIIIAIVIEFFYLKDFQNGIIQILNNKK